MKLWRSIKNHLVPWRGNAHRPHILRRQWLAAFLGVALLSEAVILGYSSLGEGPRIFLAAVVRSDVITYTEKARVGEGGQALRENEVLNAAAQAKADDMAAKSYFSHVDPTGAQPWAWFERAGYDYRFAGENLAVKFNDSQEVVDAWMASPTHRANILKPQYQEMGVGIAVGTYKGQQATFVAQFFASPSLAQAASPAAALAPPAAPDALAAAVADPASSPAAGALQQGEAPVAAVAGASIQPQTQIEKPAPPAPQPSWIQSAVRSLVEALGNSHAAATWALSLTAALLLVVIALTFFIRIQVQPTDLLLPGLTVALIAVILLGANSMLLPATQQSASVSMTAGGDVGEGVAIERASIAFPEHPSE